MSVAHFQLLSMSEAEDVVAEVCGCVEEYDIPMPDMAFGFRGRSRVNIAMRIDDPIAANMIYLRLATVFIPEKSRAHANQGPKFKI